MEYTYTVTFHGDYFSLTTHISVEPKPMDDPETLAIDLAANPQGLNYLHRDVTNIAEWINRRGDHAGFVIDAEDLFAELVATAYG